MRRAHCVVVSLSIVVLFSLLSSSATADPGVWTGLTKSFAKAAFASPLDQENRDVITDNVALSRDSQYGIFNVFGEDYYSDSSPADTLWATDLNNPGQTIGAANWDNLTFDTWVDAYGGTGAAGANVVPGDEPRNAVVYLITDDIYLDLQFTSWGVGRGAGGGFSYLRAEGVPEPAAASLIALGLLVAFAIGRLWRFA
jgi:hypothetical protein